MPITQALVRSCSLLLLSLLSCIQSTVENTDYPLPSSVQESTTNHLIFDSGQAKARIVIGTIDDPTQQQEVGYTAKRLQHHLAQIGGTELPIVESPAKTKAGDILLGPSKNLDALGLRDELKQTDSYEDAVLLRSIDHNLVIYGGPDRGLRYAVYEALERVFDCRYYLPGTPECPRQPTVVVPNIDYQHQPSFQFRDLSWAWHLEQEYLDWHKLDGDHRGRGDAWVHTFQRLLPEEKYFDEHPEYYALRGGQRVPMQPCLSHPEVKRIVGDALAELMHKQPHADFWSVSQNDNAGYCECDQCAAKDRASDSHAGALLHFVNDIADRFPDKTISTLAYMYSRHAPKNILPRKNVNIMLCSIESDRAAPLSEESAEHSFLQDLQDWSKLTSNIFIWDYTTNFAYQSAPMPILDILQPNIQSFRDAGVRQVFEQGFRRQGHSASFGDLRGYVLAKLLWDPDADQTALIQDYLSGVYGAAAPYLSSYLYKQEQYLNESKIGLGIYQAPTEHQKGYLAPEKLEEYDRFFEQGAQAVASDPLKLSRVQSARAELLYAQLEIKRALGRKPGGLFDSNNQLDPKVNSILQAFVESMETSGRTLMSERSYSVESYAQDYSQILDWMQDPSLSRGALIKSSVPYSLQYSASGDQALTDGVFGLASDRSQHWQGYQGKNVVFTLDLGQQHDITKLRASFLSQQEGWIFRPTKITVATSKDGQRFKKVYETKNEIVSRGLIYERWLLDALLKKTKARFLRLEVETIKQNPVWHGSPNGASWLFVDEIEVR